MHLDPNLYIEVDTSTLTLEQARTNASTAAVARGWGDGATNTQGDPRYNVWFTHNKTTHVYDAVAKAWEPWVRWSRIDGAEDGVKQMFALHVGETPTAVTTWDSATEEIQTTVRDNAVNALSVGGATLLDLQSEMNQRDAANRAYAESLQRRQNFKPYDTLAFFDPRNALPTVSGAYISRFTAGMNVNISAGSLAHFENRILISVDANPTQADVDASPKWNPADEAPENGLYEVMADTTRFMALYFKENYIYQFDESGGIVFGRVANDQAELDAATGWAPSSGVIPVGSTVKATENAVFFPYEKNIIHFIEVDDNGNVVSITKDSEGTNLQDVVTLVGGVADKDVLILFQVQHTDSEWGKEGEAAWSPVNAHQLTASEYYHTQQLTVTGGVAALQAVDNAQQAEIDAIKTTNTDQQTVIDANATLAAQLQTAVDAINQDLIDNYLTSDAVSARIRELVGEFKIITVNTSPIDTHGPDQHFQPGVNNVLAIQAYPEAVTGKPFRDGIYVTMNNGQTWIWLG